MKKLLALLTLFLALSGCIPAALVVGATAGGSIIYDKRSFKTMAQDKNAEVLAVNSIYNDAVLTHSVHISIAVFNRIALMVGQAPTQDLKDRAFQAVSRVRNIDRVYNEVTIANPISAYQRSRDTWLTTAIKSEMITAKGLQSTQIKVVTENSVVYLMGTVTQQQAELAANVARRVSGVVRVVKVFQYIQ